MKNIFFVHSPKKKKSKILLCVSIANHIENLFNRKRSGDVLKKTVHRSMSMPTRER